MGCSMGMGTEKQHRRSGRDGQASEGRGKELCLPVRSQRVPEGVLKIRPASTGFISAVPPFPTSTGPLGSWKTITPNPQGTATLAATQEREAGTQASASPAAGPSGLRPCPGRSFIPPTCSTGLQSGYLSFLPEMRGNRQV